MVSNPFKKKPEETRPKIWATESQRPPFNLRSFGRASLHFARQGVAPLHAWVARTGRRVALNVRDGAGRIPEAKLGRAAPYVPSHLRVAMWIKNFAAIHAHASASADPDVKRGNALVQAIEPHLWSLGQPVAAPKAPAPTEPAPQTVVEPEPVVLAEPVSRPYDPLASIRADIDRKPLAEAPKKPSVTPGPAPETPKGTPLPPGPVATMAIQIIGYGIGWASAFVALPYGLIRSLLAYAKGQDLRKIGTEE
jgi:hypothetical protein